MITADDRGRFVGCAGGPGAAALDIDDADGPRMTGQVLTAWLRQGFIGDPAEAWLIPGTAPASVAGWYRLELPDLENRDRARTADRGRSRGPAATGSARPCCGMPRSGPPPPGGPCSVARSGTARPATPSPPRSGRSQE